MFSVLQPAWKEESIPENNGRKVELPLMADLILYYCRHADQPVLVQLYRAEVRRKGHTYRTSSRVEM